MGDLPGRVPQRIWPNAILFGLTLLSTFALGVLQSVSYIHPETLTPHSASNAVLPTLLDPRVLGLGALYAVVLMTILGGHELGHYLTCRRYGIAATLPYFLPGPTLFGTFGAFIRIKSAVSTKRQWFDIGVAGPLAGFVLSLPALLVGLAYSKVVIVTQAQDATQLGEPLALKLASLVLLRPLPPGADILLHPVGFAGWAGLFVTFLNLLPLGQLDGGHVAYALLGPKKRYVSGAVLAAFVVLGVFYSYHWLIWGAIGLAYILVIRLKRPGRLYRIAVGLRHPLVGDEASPLGRGRVVLAVIIIVIFVLSFIPDPIRGASLLALFKSSGPVVK